MNTTLLVAFLLGSSGGPLEATARQVAAHVTAEPTDVAKLYHATFLNAMSEDKLIRLYTEFYRKHGQVTSVAALEQDSDYKGKFSLSFEKGVRMTVTLVITPAEPHQIIGLWFGPPVESYTAIADAVQALRELPGEVSFQLARLGGSVEVLHAHQPELALAVGSTFKLYILAALVEDRRPWDQVLHLEKRCKSLPSGALHQWPAGAPVTVHTLAAQMISVSDNTATDHLLHHVGRQRVEALLPALGNRHAEKSRPFLTTLEMFKLKSDDALLQAFVQSSTVERRALLEGKLLEIEREAVQPYPEGLPVAIDQVEWFASAADLCRLMDWLRRKNDDGALQIMAINPGLDISTADFEYVGYKGGSEPGVLNMTWLLKVTGGSHYGLSVGWNNPTAEGTKLTRLIGIVQPMIELLGKRSTTEPRPAGGGGH